MAIRHISIDHDFRPDEPSEIHARQIRQAFAELGWAVTHYGGGASNVHRCSLAIESADRQLDHPTLIATLKRSGIPLDENASTYTTIFGDVSMERRSVEWARCREADLADVHLAILGATPADSLPWKHLRIPRVAVRCVVSPLGNQPLKLPLHLEVTALREDGKPLGHFGIYSGSVWHPGETVFNVPTEEPAARLDLLVTILDIHRAGEVVFHSLPVSPSQTS